MVRVVLREMREQKERKAAKQLLYLRYQQCHTCFTLLYHARRERAEQRAREKAVVDMLARRKLLTILGEELRKQMMVETVTTLEEMGVTREELRDEDLHIMEEVEMVGWACPGQVVGTACRQLTRRWRRMLAREGGE